MKHALLAVAVAVAVALAGCGSGPQPSADAGTPPGRHQASEALRACRELAATSVSTAPELIALINALPKPVTVPCVVAALPRPLPLVATTSMMSAQPAGGPDSPRIFIMGTSLVISVVAAGSGVNLIETGEWVTATRTLKGELELPATQPLAAAAAYSRVDQSTQRTTCSLCHRDEAPWPDVAGSYASTAYRPNPGEEVALRDVTALHEQCVRTEEASARCELFHALYDFGAVQQGAFRRQVELFIQ